MNSTNDTIGNSRPNVWLLCGVLLVVVAASVWVGRPASHEAALMSALVSSAGTFAMAWLVSRHAGERRWAWWATAGVMSAVLLTGTLVAPSGAGKRVQMTAWMLPWFLMIMGTTPRGRARWCDPVTAKGSWTMVLTGFAVSLILVGSGILAHLF